MCSGVKLFSSVFKENKLLNSLFTKEILGYLLNLIDVPPVREFCKSESDCQRLLYSDYRSESSLVLFFQLKYSSYPRNDFYGTLERMNCFIDMNLVHYARLSEYNNNKNAFQ